MTMTQKQVAHELTTALSGIDFEEWDITAQIAKIASDNEGGDCSEELNVLFQETNLAERLIDVVFERLTDAIRYEY